MSYTENSMLNRVLAAILSFIMIVTVLPMGVLPVTAAGEETESGTGTVNKTGFTVTVSDDKGNPVSGATVTLNGKKLSLNGYENWVKEAETSEDGTAVFGSEDIGDLMTIISQAVTVTVTKEGYFEGTGSAELTTLNYTTKGVEVELTARPEYKLTVTGNDNATVELNGEKKNSVTAYEGSEVAVVITPKTGYTVTDISYSDGVAVGSLPEKGNEFVSTVVLNSDIDMSYTVEQITYTVEFAEGSTEFGTITPSEDNPDEFTYESQYKATVKANEGYLISSIVVEGSTYSTISNVSEADISFEVTADTNITVTYVKLHTVILEFDEHGTGSATYKDATGGTVEFTSDNMVIDGHSVYVSATPNDGYEVFEVTETVGEAQSTVVFVAVDDEKAGFKDMEFVITADTTIAVSFIIKSYEITVVGDNGSGQIFVGENVVTDGKVQHGSDVSVKVTPAFGYEVDSITVGDETAVYTLEGDVATVNVENVTADVTVTVTYKLKKYTVTVGGDSTKGTIEVPDTVEHGSELTVKVTPVFGYEVSKVIITDSEKNRTEYDVEFINSSDDNTEDYFKAIIDSVVRNVTVEAQYVDGDIVHIGNALNIDMSEVLREVGGTIGVSSQDTRHKTYTMKYVVKKGAEIKISPQKVNNDWQYSYVYTKDPDVEGVKKSGNSEYNKEVTFVVYENLLLKSLAYRVDNRMRPITTEIDGEEYYVEYEFIIDDIAPNVTVSPENKDGVKDYYNENVKFSVKITDKPDDYYSGLDTDNITFKYSYTGEKNEVVTKDLGAIFISDDTWETSIDIAEIPETEVTFTVTATDMAGNLVSENYVFTVDKTAPVIDVEFDNNDAKNEKYFCADRNATVTITEHNFDGDDVEILVNNKLLTWKDLADPEELDSDPDTHQKVVPFDVDGNYTFSVNYTDRAGNENAGVNYADGTVAPEEFTVDKTEPVDLNVEYKNDIFKTFINGLTFGFFGDDTVEVTVYAQDSLSGIDYIVYSAPVEEDSSSINKGIENTTVKFGGAKEQVSTTFEIPAQYRGKITFEAINMAGVSAEFTDDKTVVVDNTDPIVDADYFYEKDNSAAEEKEFYDDAVYGIITIKEANFFGLEEWEYEDYKPYDSDVKEPYLVITLTKIYNDGKEESGEIFPTFTKLEGEENIYVSAKILFDEDADYILDVKYSDHSGNSGSYKKNFTVDLTAPVIDVEFDNNEAMNEKYFCADRNATVTITEHNFDVENTNVLINDDTVAWKDLADPEEFDSDPDTHQKVVPFDVDGNYTFSVECTDKAGNKNAGANYADGTVAPEEFTVDKTGPEGASVIYSDSGIFHTLLESMKYGFFVNSADVKFVVQDSLSGIDYIEYYAPVEDGASDVNDSVERTKVSMEGTKEAISYTVTIPAQYRGKITFEAYNMAGESVKVTGDTTVVVDRIAPELSVKYWTKSGSDPIDNGGEFFFNEDVYASITIKEANFFGTEEWLADDYVATNLVGNPYLLITVTKTDKDGKVTIENLTPNFFKSDENDTYISEDILFSENVDYVITMEYSDRSGNAAKTATALFTVDKISPVIDVEFDNNEATNEKYFCADRNATVTITEHNFDVENTNVIINDDTVAWKDLADPEELDSDPDTHQKVVPFGVDGNYTFSVECTDKAGNKNAGVNYADGTVAHEEFTVDKTGPVDLAIKYENDISEIAINGIFFGFFGDDTVEVTVYAQDSLSGVDYIVYSAPVEEDSSSINEGIENTTVKFGGDKKQVSTTFEIPAQYRGNITFEAINMSGIPSKFTDDKIVVVDNTDPVVNVDYNTASGNAPIEYNGNPYYAENVFATITIDEANFFGDDCYSRINPATGKSYLYIELIKTDDKGVVTTEQLKPAFTNKEGDVYVSQKIEIGDDGDYILNITYTDYSDNVTTYTHSLTVDKIIPDITLVYDNNDVRNAEYFNADRGVDIYVNEHNFDPSLIEISLAVRNADEKVVKEYGEVIEALKNISNWTLEQNNVYRAHIDFADEAKYTFSVSGKDIAGNKSTTADTSNAAAPGSFIIDKTSPTDLKITLDNTTDILGTNNIGFNTFYDKPVTIQLSAIGGLSGIDYLEYQKVSSANQYDPNGDWKVYDEDTGISVGTGEKFVIFFNAVDMAGNDNKNDHGKSTVVNSIGIIVDNKAPVGVNSALNIDILPAEPNAEGYYNGDVKVEFKVTDPKYIGENKNENGFYSGINKITYEIVADDIMETETDDLFTLDSVRSNSLAQYDNDGLAHTVTGTFVIDSAKFNSNKVVVKITAVDNSGNEKVSFTTLGDIKIDTTVPTVNVSYSNNRADSGKYFDADRTATIVVTERNFDVDNFKFTVTRDGAEYPVTLTWAEAPAGDNGDLTTWTANVNFTTDGDYVFTVDSVTDLAGNVFNGAVTNYGTSVAPNEFTLDYIKPVINVSYDNNTSANGNYYSADRTATVVITEHNLDPNGADRDRITVNVGATDDGAPTTAPVITAWATIGDTHTATISYNADALYTFDITVADKAGNTSDDFAQQSFYVDKTAPTLTIEGVADRSANSGEVIPVITYSDTNFNENAVSITLMGANRGEVELDGAYTPIHNGFVFTFNDFANEKSVDDIYTLTVELVDMAGNPSAETIEFSVNRFGSTYVLDDATKELNGKYIKVPIDVVITETNANELSDIKVTLFKNNETIVLTEGEDYRIDLEGGNGSWYKYTYVIFADNFTADGVYSLTVESNDAAGNEAKNDIDTKNTQITFGVDNTLPIINIENLEDRNTYATDMLTVEMSIQDNLKLAKVIVELDGKNIREWTGEELDAIVNGGGYFTFDIDGTSIEAHKLVVYAVDAAGNGEIISEEEIPANAEIVEGFFVTTNLWVRYFTNKPLFYGSIGAVILAVGLVIFLIVFKKNKKEEKGR